MSTHQPLLRASLAKRRFGFAAPASHRSGAGTPERRSWTIASTWFSPETRPRAPATSWQASRRGS